MTPDKDAEIARLRRELEVALEAARVNGEERNELARQLGAEVATTQRLTKALRDTYGLVKAAFVSKRADGRYWNDVDPGAQVRIKAVLREYIDAALASGNGDGGGE